MSSRFFTNHESNTLLKKFEGIFAHNPELVRFDALVGYLRASGYFALRPHLQKVPVVRILVGINVDNIVEEYHRKGQLFLADGVPSVLPACCGALRFQSCMKCLKNLFRSI